MSLIHKDACKELQKDLNPSFFTATTHNQILKEDFNTAPSGFVLHMKPF